MTNQTRITLPKPIYLYTALLGIFGIGMGLWSAISPMGMFEIGKMTLDGTGRDMIIYLFAARNFAFGILFLLALMKYRTKEVFLTIYIARLILDIADTLAIGAVGMMGIDRLLEQLLFLVPVPIIIYYLTKVESKNQS